MTTGERTAQIDRQLDDSFGVFDGRIRDEQATIAGQRAVVAVDRSGGGRATLAQLARAVRNLATAREGDGKGGQGGGRRRSAGRPGSGCQGQGQGNGQGQGQGQQGQGQR